MTRATRTSPPPLHLLDVLFSTGGELPDPSDPLGVATREFFEHNWAHARDGLLDRTELIRVRPLPPEGPRAFAFEIDRPYKRKLRTGEVDVAPGPIHGRFLYAASLLRHDSDTRPVVAVVDARSFFHPNFSRSERVLCVGDLPPGPFPLDALLEHLWSIVTYQNIGLRAILDREAAHYFATNPLAFDGVGDVPPLY